MTVADNTSRNQYTATSGQTVFAYTFEIVDKSHIVVLKNGVALSEGTNYTVSNVGNDSGGNITLTVGATTGDIMTFYRDMPYSRTQNYTNSGDFLASEVNSDFDDLWLAGEQTDRAFSQSIRKPITDSTSISMELPEAASRTNSFLTFDANGAVSVESLASGNNPTNIFRQQFTGNGSTTVFTLAADPGSAAAVMIYIDGVYQEEGTYTVSGTSLTFTEAPPVNASIEAVLYRVTDIGTTTASAVSITDAGNYYTSSNVEGALQETAQSQNIVYAPAGTGAVQTTVQSKLRETVSVKDFGAVGDGVTDDTAAIQAMITANSNGGIFYFPTGVYLYSDNLTFPANSTIHGDGRQSEFLLGAVRKYITLLDNGTAHSLKFNGNSNIIGPDNPTLNGLLATRNGASVSNCYFTNAIGSQLVTSDGQRLRAYDNVFEEWGDHAIYYSTEAEDIIIYGNYFTSPSGGAEAIKFRNGGTRIAITGNTCSNIPCLVMMTSETSNINEISITGNSGTTSNHSILFTRTGSVLVDGVSITGNVFENIDLPVSYVAISMQWLGDIAVENIVVNGNVFKNYTSIVFAGDGDAVTLFKNVVYSNNIFSQSSGVSTPSSIVGVSNIEGSMVFTNNIFDIANSNLYFMNIGISGKFIFSNNRVNVTSTYGIRLNNQTDVNLIITNNEIKTFGRRLFFQAGVDYYSYVLISGNAIESNEAIYPNFFDRAEAKFPSNFVRENNIVNGRPYINNLTSAPTVGTYIVGDIEKNKTPSSGGTLQWVCTTSGTFGSYSEGLTATSTGTAVITLSGTTSVLKEGMFITFNGANVRQILNISGTSVTLSSAISSGGPYTLAYQTPVFTAQSLP